MPPPPGVNRVNSPNRSPIMISDFKDDDNEQGPNCSGWEGRRGSPGATIASSSSLRLVSPLVLAMSGGSPMSPIRMEVSGMGANL